MAISGCAPTRDLYGRVSDLQLTGMPRVRIPTPLLSYTNATWVHADGETVDEVMQNLDRAYPGLRFRVVDEQNAIRKHMRIFLNDNITDLSETVCEVDIVTLMQALSGG